MAESLRARQQRWQRNRRPRQLGGGASDKAKLQKLEAEAATANAPSPEPTQSLTNALFSRAQEGASNLGQALRMGFRGIINTPYAFSAIVDSLRETGEMPSLGRIASELYADPEGTIFKGSLPGLGKVEVGGVKPERISFDQELNLLGVPEIGKPSDVPLLGLAYTQTGEGLPLQKGGLLDPTVREAAGFIGEAYTSPISTLRLERGLQAGIARTPAGKAIARVFVSKEGSTAFRKIYDEVITARFGKPAAEVVTKMTREQMEEARDEAATRLWTMAAKSPKLIEQPHLEVFGGVRVPLSEQIISAGAKLRGRAARRLERYTPYQAVARLAKNTERLFSVVTTAAKKYPGVEETVSEYHAMRRNLGNQARSQIERWTKGLKGKPGPNGMPLDDYVRNSLDDPERFPVEALPKEVQDVVEEMKVWRDDLFQTEVGLGYAVRHRENYIKHLYHVSINGRKARPITAEEWEQLGGEQAMRFLGSRVSTTVGGATQARTFATYTDAIGILNQQATERGLAWKLTPAPLEESLLVRGLDHAEAVAAAKMEGRFLLDHGIDPEAAIDQHFKTILPELHQLVNHGVTDLEGAYKTAGAKLEKIMLDYAQRSKALTASAQARAARQKVTTLGRTLETERARVGRRATILQGQLETAREALAALEKRVAEAAPPRQVLGKAEAVRQYRVRQLESVATRLERRLKSAEGPKWNELNTKLKKTRAKIAQLSEREGTPIEVPSKPSILREKRVEALRARVDKLERRLARTLVPQRAISATTKLKPKVAALNDAALSPRTLGAGEQGYVYHATSRDALNDIAEGALRPQKPSFRGEQTAWPDGTTRARSYWSTSPKGTEPFWPEPSKSVIVRTKSGKGFAAERGTGDIITNRPIPATELEYLSTTGWKPLAVSREAEAAAAAARQLQRAAQRGVKAAMRSKGGIKFIKRQDQLAKAFYWMTKLRSVTNFAEFEAVAKEHPGALGIDDKLVKAMREYLGTSYKKWTNTFRDQYDELLVEYGGASRTFFLPKAIADDARRLLETRPLPPELRDALHLYDTATALWKAGVTITVPAFFSRNGYSNLATSFVDVGFTAFNPLRGKRAMAIMNGAEGTIRTPTGNVSFSQFRDAMRHYGVFNDADFALEVGGTARGSKILAHGPIRRLSQVNSYIENWSKLSLALAHFERGEGLRGAAFRTQQVLFDYESLTAIEKSWFRRIMPFYTWWSKNMKLYAKLMVEEPGRISMLERFNTTNDPDRAPENGSLSAYLAGTYKLRTERKGKVSYFYGIDLPHRAFLDNFFVGDNGLTQTLKRFGATINPTLKAIQAVQFQQDPMTGADLKLPREVDAGWTKIINALPERTKDWLEFRQTPEGKWQMNGTKSYLLFQAFAVQRMLWPLAMYGEAKKKNYALDNTLLDIALGINSETFDLTELQRRKIRAEIRKTEERLIRAGVRRPYTLNIPIKEQPSQ